MTYKDITWCCYGDRCHNSLNCDRALQQSDIEYLRNHKYIPVSYADMQTFKCGVVEWCQCCEDEVVLKRLNKIVQTCPNCSNSIRACSLCTQYEMDCSVCDKGES